LKELQGIAAAPGISIGEAIWWKNEELTITERTVDDPEQETERLAKAIAQAKEEISQLRQQTATKMGESEAAIFDAHLAFLDDPIYTGEMKQRIESQKRNAEAVCQEVTQETKQMLSSLDDEYMQARADDVADVGHRLLRLLTGKSTFDPLQLRAGHIVVAEELTPSQTAQFPAGIAGMITARGSQTAHAAIMARTLGIPAVLGMGEQIQEIHNGAELILDGNKGSCTLGANPTLLKETQQKIELAKKQHENALQEAVQDAYTADGKRIQVFANIGSPQDVDAALANHAEGVGLFRTEFLYLENDHWPTEEEQYQAYRQVLSAFGDKPVIIRTLDIGGDKELPYANLPREENPFLGHRAVRFCLDHPEIFRTQLTALLRASQHGNLWIMLPMVENATEIRATKKLLEECKQDLMQRQIPFAESIPLGIMIEVPAAAIIADQLAAEVDFMSIGTNDLTQYTLAADRGNEKVAHLYDALHPAVLRLIKMTCDAGKKHNIVIGMCGELAGDVNATQLLIELGLDELSMSAASIPIVKQRVRSVDTQNPSQQLERILAAEDGEAVRQIING
jgi:phosphotransferase system enzyme I (PtsI)